MNRNSEIPVVAEKTPSVEKYEVEPKGIDKKLTDLEAQFFNQMDGLLKRKVITEAQFDKIEVGSLCPGPAGERKLAPVDAVGIDQDQTLPNVRKNRR